MEYLEFSPLERKIYNSLFNSAKRDFEQLDAKGLIGKNYTHILAMLMRYVFLYLKDGWTVLKIRQAAASRASSESRALI